MYRVNSELEGKKFALIDMEDALKPLGFSIGGGWDYDGGSFDYQLGHDDGYVFLRIPFRAIDGSLDQHGAIVEVMQPFVLKHRYEAGLDKEADVTNRNALINQFQSPVEKDADVNEQWVESARKMLQKVERELKIGE